LNIQGEIVQTEGPSIEKARLCMVEVGAKGNWRRPCSAEWREQAPRVLL